MWPCIWVILGFIAILGFSAFYRLSWLIWLPALALATAASFYLGALSLIATIIISIILVSMAALLGILPLRRELITQHLFSYFKKVLPPISKTEQEALLAGNTFWEAELIQGSPNWKKLNDIQDTALTSEEQSFINNQTETLCKMIDDWKVFCKQDLPQEAWDYIRKERFWALIIPKEYGGLGFSTYAHSTIVMKLASRNVALAVTVMVPNSLGPGELIAKYGTKEQKDYYLPRLADGSEVPCFGLTEPMAGSDAGAMEAKGIVCRGQHEGKEVLGIKLNWDKRYITLAPIATVIGVAFKLYDPDKLIGNKKDIGITLGLIPAKHAGIKSGERHLPLAAAFMNGPLHGRDVFIPLDWIIGGVEQVGHGWQMLMECLAVGRAISLPAMGVATAKVCYRMTGAYASLRRQFNVPIGNFSGVQEVMGRIGGLAYMADATRIFTASVIDSGYHPAIASAITKYYLTEFSRTIINDAMDVQAGRGIIIGPRNYLAHGYMSIPIGITVEGANILTRSLMIFGQGSVRCHPYVLPELQAASNPDQTKGAKDFDRLIIKHIGYVLSNLVRLRVSQIGSWWDRKASSDITSVYYSQLTRLSNTLAVMTDLAFAFLGGQLKRDENISSRFADVLGYLYMASAVMRYFEKNKRPTTDLPYVEWSLDHSIYIIQKALVEICENFPRKNVRWLLRWICFPFSLPYRPPKDSITQKIALSMQELSDLRDRITKNIFLSTDPKDPMGRIEFTFKSSIAAQPALKKLRAAIKAREIDSEYSLIDQIESAQKQQLLTAAETQMLHEYYNAVSDALAVDAFTQEEINQWWH